MKSLIINPHYHSLPIYIYLPAMILKTCRTLLLIFFATSISQAINAQDTLPNFTVEDKGGGRIVVSWQNPYSNLVQLAVQRSIDSLKRFSSVFSATSPELPLNGFSDKVPPGINYYYRIFYVMKGGSYYFSISKKASTPSPENKVYDSRRDKIDESLVERIENAKKDTAEVINPIFIKTKSGVISLMPVDFIAYRDSILTKTNDTLIQLAADTVTIAPYSPPFLQRTSQFVFTDRDGFIVVKLPDSGKKYDLVFLEEDDTPVLEFKNLKELQFTIDKTNFYHGGWYKFEIKENGRIMERNKVFLPTDF
jgi:hypothetical protein